MLLYGTDLKNKNELTILFIISPISYNNSNGQISSLFTASSSDTLTNKSMSYDQLTSTPTIPTNNNQHLTITKEFSNIFGVYGTTTYYRGGLCQYWC